jgi:hypothetical protein
MIPGLRFIFRPVSLSSYQLEFEDGEDRLSKFSAIFDSTRKAFIIGARQLGLPEHLPFSFLSLQAQGLADTTVAPLQLRLCQDILTSYPTLWNGYDCAGDALARMGRASEATASYRRGAEAARNVGDSATADRLTRKAAPRRNVPVNSALDRSHIPMSKERLKDSEAKALLLGWPTRTQLWPPPMGVGFWLRAQPREGSAAGARISSPGVGIHDATRRALGSFQ